MFSEEHVTTVRFFRGNFDRKGLYAQARIVSMDVHVFRTMRHPPFRRPFQGDFAWRFGLDVADRGARDRGPVEDRPAFVEILQKVEDLASVSFGAFFCFRVDFAFVAQRVFAGAGLSFPPAPSPQKAIEPPASSEEVT